MKKLVSVILVLAMVLAFASCTQQSDSATTTTASDDTTTAAETEETETETETSTVDFPTKEITFIVGANPGGGSDLAARTLAEAVEEYLGVTVVVENRPGGTGMVAATAVAEAEPDGYTWLLGAVWLVTLPALGQADLSWEDFIPVCKISDGPACISVPADSPYETIQDLVEAARENPDTITIANGGAGGSFHLSALSIQNDQEVSFVHVPYSGGTSDAVVAAVGGHVDAVVSQPSEVDAQVQAGTLRILAVATEERLDIIPDVPTFKESGIDVVIGTWTGLFLPLGTPDEIVDIIEEACLQAEAEQSFLDTMATSNAIVDALNSDELYGMLENQTVLFGGVVDLLEDS